MHRFSVIIVSWNALEHLKNYLPSVVETDYPDFEIILADNASTDGSAEWTREHCPGVKIVSLDNNYGYCGGNNRAARHADGDIIVFLNNDVKVEPDWLAALNRCFQSHQNIAAAQPKMLSVADPESFEYAGAAGGYLDKYGFPFCRGRIFDTLEKDHGQYDRKSEIFWASGAALAIRREVFESFGGFDEDFEFHMEEIDLCWQILNSGRTILYCPESVVYHLGGGSLPMGSPRKVYYNYRNNLAMLWKNYSRKSLYTRFPVRLMLDIIAMKRSLFTGSFRDAAAIIRAFFSFLKRLPDTHRKRKSAFQKRKQHANPDLMLDRSIVWQYFVNKKRTFDEITGSNENGLG